MAMGSIGFSDCRAFASAVENAGGTVPAVLKNLLDGYEHPRTRLIPTSVAAHMKTTTPRTPQTPPTTPPTRPPTSPPVRPPTRPVEPKQQGEGGHPTPRTPAPPGIGKPRGRHFFFRKAAAKWGGVSHRALTAPQGIGVCLSGNFSPPNASFFFSSGERCPRNALRCGLVAVRDPPNPGDCLPSVPTGHPGGIASLVLYRTRKSGNRAPPSTSQ
jgi:hypothetical protein